MTEFDTYKGASTISLKTFRTPTNRGVLLSTLLQDIIHPSHHLLNVLLQIANKLGLSNKKNYSLIVLPLNAVQSGPITASLNKREMK
jgi:hypothetical protein